MKFKSPHSLGTVLEPLIIDAQQAPELARDLELAYSADEPVCLRRSASDTPPPISIGIPGFPQCPDGGYFIFITIDKEEMDSAFDYEDAIYSDVFRWITRRGRRESHYDYIQIRKPSTRVSLFARNNPAERFVYIGELTYISHKELSAKSKKDVQQEYFFKLPLVLPDNIEQELSAGVPKKKSSGTLPAKGIVSGKHRSPRTFDELKRAFSYVVGSAEKIVTPAHHNHQVALSEYLRKKNTEPVFEEDFVDVQFELENQRYIGEIKVTTNLTVPQAFRAALGQILDYGYLQFKELPRMIIFLDKSLDPERVALASRLGIAVVTALGNKLKLSNPNLFPELTRVFD